MVAGTKSSLRCDKPLANNRTCCQTEGHEKMRLQGWKGNERHSHTWQPGFGRFAECGEYVLDMETGEIVGDSWAGFDASRYRGDYDPMQVLRLYGIEGIEMELIEIIPDKTLPTVGYNWHYRGERHVYGVNDKGFNVEFVRDTGEVIRLVSANEQKQIMRSARISGPTRAARKYGLKVGTVKSWISRAA